MSRKDLSRTVIEGGRYFHNSYFRRASHGITRARTREWLDHVRVDLDEADETAPRPGPRVHKMFRDKLGPAKRWLNSQVGRPWAKVYSELCEQFDTRTVAGRHVVHDHMLGWVERTRGEAGPGSRGDFFVDAHGILRRDPYYGRSWWRVREQVLAMAKHRRAAKTFRGWWWFRKEPEGEPCPRWGCRQREHHYFGATSYHAIRFVADAAVTPAELRSIERLGPDLRALVVIDADLVAAMGGRVR